MKNHTETTSVARVTMAMYDDSSSQQIISSSDDDFEPESNLSLALS